MKYLALPLVFASTAAAWGTLGHTTVALLSQQYLLPGTISTAQTLLNDSSSTYLGNIATWADSYRYTSEGAYSAGLHYVNGLDAPPPESCKIIFPEDCGGGCIIDAIANYTQRVKDTGLDITQRGMALKFVVHFLGDIAQPLHTEAFGEGANNITVYFNGYKTNLHAAWDTSIPNYILGLPPTAKINITTDSQGWADTLAAEVNSGEYRRLVPGWLKHLSVAAVDREEKAATEWANESNEEVCDYAMIKGGNAYNGTEIGGAYFEGAKPIVEISIAKAGVRLAAWLNLIFEGKTGFEGRGRGSYW